MGFRKKVLSSLDLDLSEGACGICHEVLKRICEMVDLQDLLNYLKDVFQKW